MSDKKIFGLRLLDSKKAKYEKSGTPLIAVKLIDILDLCYRLKNDGKKGERGAVFTYDNNVLGKDYFPEDGIYNAGVILSDIDHITKKIADDIFSNFYRIKEAYPYIIAIQYSSSYYLHKDGQDVGLHVYLASDELNETDYYNCAMIGFWGLCETIKNILGYDFVQADAEMKAIKGDNSGAIIDHHNYLITQRFLLYHSAYQYKISDDQECLNPDVIKTGFLKEVYDKYSVLKDTYIQTREYKKINKEDITRYNGEINNNNGERYKVDRNFHIWKYAGNDCRWRISNIFNHIYKDPVKAKEECDKWFYYDNNKSIWSDVYTGVSHPVIEWLKVNGVIHTDKPEDKNSFICQDCNEVHTYLSEEYYDFIKSEINSHNVLTIQGDTGIGKTVCIAKLCKELNGCILTPTLSMRKLYEREGVEIVERNNQDDFEFSERPFVCVFDRFTLIKKDISDKTVFIDESHVMFTDRSYRKSLVKLLEILKDRAGKIILVSATPLVETKILNSEKTIKFARKKKTIDLLWTQVERSGDLKYFINTAVRAEELKQNYDRLCVFGNHTPRMLYDNALFKTPKNIVHRMYNIFHRDYDNVGDLERITTTEYIDKHYNFGTSIVFNGLNFKNNNEKIIIYIEWYEFVNSYWEIIQIIGRFRNNNEIYIVVVECMGDNPYSDINRQKAELLDELKISHKVSAYNTDYVEFSEMTEQLQAWYEGNTSENVRKILTEEFGINIKMFNTEIKEDDNYRYNQVNKLKNEIDEIVKKELFGEELTDRENKLKLAGWRYYNNIEEKVRRLMFDTGCNINDVSRLYKSVIIKSKNNNKTVSLGRVIDNYYYIREVSQEEPGYWTEKMNEFVKRGGNLGAEINKIVARDLNKAKTTAEKFNGIYFAMGNLLGNQDKILMDAVIKDNEEKKSKKVKSRSEAGKKGGKKCMYDGVEYNSLQECAISICKSIGTVKRWVKNKKIKLLE